jgi:hypothetical protein
VEWVSGFARLFDRLPLLLTDDSVKSGFVVEKSFALAPNNGYIEA